MTTDRRRIIHRKKMSEKAVFAVEFGFCFCILTGIAFMPITAFDLPVPKLVAFLCVVFAGAAAVVVARGKKRIFAALPVLLAVFAVLSLLFRSHMANGWNDIKEYFFLRIIDGYIMELVGTDGDVAFCAAMIGTLYMFVAAWLFLRDELSFFCAVLSLMLVLCYYRSEPAAWCELMFFAGFAVFVMTVKVKKALGREKWAQLAIRLAVPVAVLMTVLGHAWKKSDYDAEKFPYKPGRDIFAFATETASKIISGGETGFESKDGLPSENVGNDISLDMISENHPSGETVMWVKSDERHGGFFLRGTAYSIYEDGKWKVCEDENVDDKSYIVNSTLNFDLFDKITVRTVEPLKVLYVPYDTVAISAEATAIGDAYIKNTSGQTTYTFCCDSDDTRKIFDFEYEEFVNEKCLYLPDELKEGLLEIAEQAGLTKLEKDELPNAVRDFIRQSAEYDLNVKSVPQGEDFILWFLTESKRGYCMHFASACTAMLRALGTPARYVSGYAVIADKFEFTDSWRRITGYNAHAWTEYYVSGVGWRPLDATGCVPGGPEVTAQVVSSSDVQELSESVPEFQNGNPSGVAHEGVDKEEIIHTESDTQNEGYAEKTDKKELLPPVVKIVLLVIFVPAALWTANFLVCRSREKKLDSGDVNTRVIENRRYIEKLCAALETNVDGGVNDIALKARFSNHTVSDEELLTVCEYRDSLLVKLKEEDDLLVYMKNKFIKFLF